MSDGFPYPDSTLPGNFAYRGTPVNLNQRESDGSVEDIIERLRFLSREAGGNPCMDKAAAHLERLARIEAAVFNDWGEQGARSRDASLHHQVILGSR